MAWNWAEHYEQGDCNAMGQADREGAKLIFDSFVFRGYLWEVRREGEGPLE